MPIQPKTWLFVPANQPRLIAKAFQSRTDALILDLEDSVPEQEKCAARDEIARVAKRQDGCEVWVRTNPTESDWFAEDLSAVLANEQITGIFIPKAEKIVDLPAPDALARPGKDALKLGLLIESARGVLNLDAILSACPAVSAVMFGGAENGDLMADLGCNWSIEGPELLHARQHTLLAIRAAKGVQAIDGVFSALDDLTGLAADTRLSRRLGFRSRAVVHPAQIECVNQIYAPQPEELAWARRVTDAFDTALARGVGAVRVDGRLVDYAMAGMARRILESAVTRDISSK